MAESEVESVTDGSNNLPSTDAFRGVDMSLAGIVTKRESFETLQRVAKLWASSQFVPERYRNVADCAMAIHMSLKLEVDPIFFMQKAYSVNGKMALEGQLVIAIAKNKGPWVDGIHFEFSGAEGTDQRTCVAYGVRRNDGVRNEYKMSYAEARKFGWVDKKDSFWPKMPDQMLCFRTAVFLVRRICPGILMGMSTVDEIRDISSARVSETVSGRLSERLANVQVLNAEVSK